VEISCGEDGESSHGVRVGGGSFMERLFRYPDMSAGFTTAYNSALVIGVWLRNMPLICIFFSLTKHMPMLCIRLLASLHRCIC